MGKLIIKGSLRKEGVGSVKIQHKGEGEGREK